MCLRTPKSSPDNWGLKDKVPPKQAKAKQVIITIIIVNLFFLTLLGLLTTIKFIIIMVTIIVKDCFPLIMIFILLEFKFSFDLDEVVSLLWVFLVDLFLFLLIITIIILLLINSMVMFIKTIRFIILAVNFQDFEEVILVFFLLLILIFVVVIIGWLQRLGLLFPFIVEVLFFLIFFS